MSELVTLSISVVKSIFGMINSSLHSDILRLQINHILCRDFLHPHDNLELLVVIQQHVYIAWLYANYFTKNNEFRVICSVCAIKIYLLLISSGAKVYM